MKIRIYYDGIAYRLKKSKNCLKLMEKVIRNESKVPGDLSFIITTDNNLLSINREFLGHNYYTDVIAFNENSGRIISGEIYISLETVKRNAHNYNVSLRNELIRVMIHGTLHLCGYTDSNPKEKKVMRGQEDVWLDKLKRE